MATVKYQKNCNLCGLPVEIEGFSLLKDQERLSFCCAGCQSIYQLIYMNAKPQKIEAKTNNNNEDD